MSERRVSDWRSFLSSRAAPFHSRRDPPAPSLARRCVCRQAARAPTPLAAAGVQGPEGGAASAAEGHPQDEEAASNVGHAGRRPQFLQQTFALITYTLVASTTAGGWSASRAYALATFSESQTKSCMINVRDMSHRNAHCGSCRLHPRVAVATALRVLFV